MGRIFRVRDEVEENRSVVLKIMRSDRVSKARLDSLRNEYEILSGIHHPNIEQVYGFGRIEKGPDELEGSTFLSAEYLRGNSLRKEEKNRSWESLCDVVVSICRGLQFLHARDLIHHDVKPGNIMVLTSSDETDEESLTTELIKLIDFGLADRQTLSGGMEIKGTPSYMAPEIIRREPLDGRVDLYALGVVLYEQLSGKPPFRGETSEEVLRKHLKKPVSSLEPLAEDVPARLEALIHKLLSKQPGRRPSGGEIIQALSELTDSDYRQETEETLKGYTVSLKTVGREEELTFLRKKLAKTCEGEENNRSVLLEGERGIGKSRLLKELRIHAQINGITTLRGQAKGAEESVYQLFKKPINQLIRNLETESDRIKEDGQLTVNEFAPYLGKIIPSLSNRYDFEEPPELDSEKEQIRFLNQVASFFVTAAKEEPILLLLDDLASADDMSIRLVKSLIRISAINNPDHRLLIVGAWQRSGEGPQADTFRKLSEEGYLDRITLDPLSNEETRALVKHMIGGDSNAVIDEITSKAGPGNPLIVEELIRMCAETDVLTFDRNQWRLDREKWKLIEAPKRTGVLLEQRVDRLSDRTESWLLHLVLWGGKIAHSVMNQMFPEEVVLPGVELNRLEQKQFIEHETRGDKNFYHLTQDRIESILRERTDTERIHDILARLMDQLEEWTEGEPDRFHTNVERLARFAWELNRDEEFREYGVRAAEKAEKRHARNRAIWFYERILQLETTEERSHDLHEKLGTLSLDQNQPEEAKSHFRQILDGTPNPDQRIRVTRKLARALQQSEEPDQAESLYKKHLETGEHQISQTMPDDVIYERIKLLTSFARFLWKFRGRLAEASKKFNLALQRLDYLHSSDRKERLEADIKTQITGIQIKRNKLDASLDTLKELLQFYRENGLKEMEAEVEKRTGNLYYRKNQPEPALNHYENALALNRDLKNITGRASVHLNMGNTFFQGKNQLKKARKEFRKCYDIARTTGDKPLTAHAGLNLGYIEKHLGNLEQAEQLTERALEISESLDNQRRQWFGYSYLGDIHYEYKNIERAFELCHQAERLSEELEHPGFQFGSKYLRVRLHLLRENISGAEEILSELDELKQHRQTHRGEKRTLELKAMKEQKAGLFQKALRLERRLVEETASEQFTEEDQGIHNLHSVLNLLMTSDFYRETSFRNNYEDRVGEWLQTGLDQTEGGERLKRNIQREYISGLFEYVTENRHSGALKVQDALEQAESSNFITLADRILDQFARIEKLSSRERSPGKRTITQEREPTQEPEQTRHTILFRESTSGSERQEKLPESSDGDELQRVPDNATVTSSHLRFSVAGSALVSAIKRILKSDLDFEENLEATIQSAADITGARSGYVLMEASDGIRVLARTEVREENPNLNADSIIILDDDQNKPTEHISKKLLDRTLNRDAPLLIQNPDQDETFRTLSNIEDLRSRSVISVPIHIDDGTRGIIYLENDSEEHPFDDRDLHLVAELADEMIPYLENVRTHENQKKELKRTKRKLDQLQSTLETRYDYDNIIGSSEPMKEVFDLMDRVIPTDLSVLIEGETGTGKELVARAIHFNGPRSEESFLAVNCARFSENMLESELFGHVEGAFTGATRDRPGLFEQADGGTLFLDEVTGMSPDMQQRLLRVLETGRVRRVGGETEREVDVRILSATNESLEQLIAEDRFREDLYYRLKDAKISLPPLRERPEDIPDLVQYFLEEIAEERNEEVKDPSQELLQLLLQRDWPGNVRELRSKVRQMAMFAGSRTTIKPVDLQESSTHLSLEEIQREETETDDISPVSPSVWRALSPEDKKGRIKQALEKTGGNKTRAARLLGITRQTVYNYMQKLNRETDTGGKAKQTEHVRSGDRKKWKNLNQSEKQRRIRRALEKTDGNKAEAAELLGITRQTIYNVMNS